MTWNVVQVLVKIDSLHESVECENRVEDTKIIRNEQWQNALIWGRIRFGIIIHDR